MSNEVRLQGLQFFRPWPELHHTAEVLCRVAEAVEKGSAHVARAALVFTAFSIEAFVQQVGPMVLGVNWSKRLERKGPLQKLHRIAEHVGIPVDLALSPWPEMEALFSARDDLAHAKPADRPIDAIVSAEAVNDLFFVTRHIRDEYHPLESISRLRNIAEISDALLIEIWVAAGQDRHTFLMFGAATWHVQQLSAERPLESDLRD
jgi:hypothetical protein